MSYRVFLSHSRSDERIARWLQHELNAYHTPGSLVGIQGAHGPVPAKFKLSRTASAHLDDEQAPQHPDLDESQVLIVLCSASAAQDPRVNHDVDAFRALGRARNILPVIVSDAPDTSDVERDYFPPGICGLGLFRVDLRERKLGDVLSGDGREGGKLKLIAALLGVEVARVAEHERRRQDRRVVALGFVAVILALATAATAASNVALRQRAVTVEAQRLVAARNAMRAVQLRREALAAAEQQSAQRTQANGQLQRAKNSLLEAVRDITSMSDLALDEIGASHTASHANLRTLAAIEQTYWNLGEISAYFELRPNSITSMLEKISSTYAQIDRADESRRVGSRFARLNDLVAGDHAASPVWRSAYAAGVAVLANQRGANGDNLGQMSALRQAGRIYEDVCLATPPAVAPAAAQSDARAVACLRFASVALARMRLQRDAQQNVDLPALGRARVVVEAAIAAYPNNAQVQSQGPRLRDQLTRVIEQAQSGDLTTAAAQ